MSWALLVLGGLLATAASEDPPSSGPADLAPMPRAGRSTPEAEELYRRICATCHGEAGRGDGPAAKSLEPKPRDFTRGVYKLKSTASGSPPSDEDLFDTLARGIPGTGMPAWRGLLSDRELRLLVDQVKSFAEVFAEAAPEALPDPGDAPLPGAERIAGGREMFLDVAKGACFQCHGTAGRGDGPSAAALQDDAGNPLAPRDLTRPWTFKRGASARAIFSTLTSGMDGAAMPSYNGALTAEERWDLALFVASLGRPRSIWDELFLDDPYLTPAAAEPR